MSERDLSTRGQARCIASRRVATRLTAVPPRPAADERIETRTLALDTALELARTGELRDAKTLVALLLEARRRAAQA